MEIVFVYDKSSSPRVRKDLFIQSCQRDPAKCGLSEGPLCSMLKVKCPNQVDNKAAKDNGR